MGPAQYFKPQSTVKILKSARGALPYKLNLTFQKENTIKLLIYRKTLIQHISFFIRTNKKAF